MMRYYMVFFFFVTLVLFSRGLCVAFPYGEDFVLNITKIKELDNPQEDFFAQYAEETELILDVKNIEFIDKSIAKLKNLRTLVLYNSSEEPESLRIPLELLNIPSLEELWLYTTNELELPEGTNPKDINSNIKSIILSRESQKIFNLMPYLHKLAYLGLEDSSYKKLPQNIEKLTNLKELYINLNRAPLHLDESLCKLSNLETLALPTQILSLPPCMNQLTHLKRIAMVAGCGERQHLPDYGAVYFPVALLAVPNLEELYFWTQRIEIPPQKFGPKHLKRLTIDDFGYFNFNRAESICSLKEGEPPSEDDIFPIDLDKITTYSEMEYIDVYNDLGVTGNMDAYNAICNSPQGKIGRENPTLLAIKKFIDQIDTAYKTGKLQHLRMVQFWDRVQSMDEPDNLIPLWKKPLHGKKSGKIPPPKVVEWELDTEKP